MSDEHAMCRINIERARRLHVEAASEADKLRDAVRTAMPLLLKASEAGVRGDFDGVYALCEDALEAPSNTKIGHAAALSRNRSYTQGDS